MPRAPPAKIRRREEIGPIEDLICDHGALRRVLLIYERALGTYELDRMTPQPSDEA